MNLIWGATLTILTLIAWIGQTITAFSPKLGTGERNLLW